MLAVVGPGAVGGLLGALAHRAGAKVTMIVRPGTTLTSEHLSLRVSSMLYGDFHARVPAAARIPTGADVLLAVKAGGLNDVLPLVHNGSAGGVLSILNGIEHAEILRAALPELSISCASVTVEVARSGLGAIHHRSAFCRLTVPESSASWSVVTTLEASGVEVVPAADERRVLWGKFRFLAPMALLTSYWREELGAALTLDSGLTHGLLAEVAAVATADGVPTDADELHQVLRGFAPTMRSSLQHDLESGRAGELDALGGALFRRGRLHGVPTPCLDKVMGKLTSSITPAGA